MKAAIAIAALWIFATCAAAAAEEPATGSAQTWEASREEAHKRVMESLIAMPTRTHEQRVAKAKAMQLEQWHHYAETVLQNQVDWCGLWSSGAIVADECLDGYGYLDGAALGAAE